jgi:putative hydrolase of HD superfamily
VRPASISSRLKFLREAERLKDTLRSAYTKSGRTESVAEHTWRLTLLAITFADELPEVDLLKMLKICILHDLGEAVDGDIPAPMQSAAISKSGKERNDFLSLVEPLPDELKSEFISLWDEYDDGKSPEACAAKALDKLETILQHNQGLNPEDFDYKFNLEYGRAHTNKVPIAASIRDLLDSETAAKASQGTRRD